MVPFMQSGVPIVGRWAEHSGELQGCPDCGYLAFSPLPSDQVLGEYYGSQYWELGGSAQEAKADYEQGGGYKTAAGELVQIWREAGIGNEAARLHEIGCGYGVAVHYLSEAGVAATGSDLSSSAVRIARENGNPHTEALPLKAYLAEHPDDRINFFYMSHSLEHMPEPAGLVQDVHDHLPAGGLFVIRVPNGMYLLSRLQSIYEYTWLQYPDHLHYFTPKSAVCLLERGGFEICSVSTLVRETLPQLMISASLGRQWAQLPDPGAWLRGICANWLGMELQIIARKSPRGVVGPSAGVRQALDRFEADTRRMEAPPRVAGANIAAFDPRGMAGEWRYAAVQDGSCAPVAAGRRWQAPHLRPWHSGFARPALCAQRRDAQADALAGRLAARPCSDPPVRCRGDPAGAGSGIRSSHLSPGRPVSAQAPAWRISLQRNRAAARAAGRRSASGGDHAGGRLALDLFARL